MARTVRPVKVKKAFLGDVPVGSLFTMDGVRYVKLSDFNEDLGEHVYCAGVLATTLLPLCEFDSVYQSGNSKKSIEERAVCMFMAATANDHSNDIITYGFFDVDDFRRFGPAMYPHIKDVWYVDNGIHDALSAGEYFFVDEFCNLCKGNEFAEKEDGVSRRIGVRALYTIEADAIVTVRTNN